MREKLIAFVIIVESCKGIVNVSIIHKRFVDSFEKQSFVIADKKVGNRWAKRGTHSHAIHLPMHYIIENEFNREISSLHQLNKKLHEEKNA